MDQNLGECSPRNLIIGVVEKLKVLDDRDLGEK